MKIIKNRIINQEEEEEEEEPNEYILSDYYSSAEKVFDLIYPELKDKTYPIYQVFEYIYIDAEYSHVWLLDRYCLNDGVSAQEPVAVHFADFVRECFTHLENKCIENEIFGFTSKCEQAYHNLEPVLSKASYEDRQKLSSLLGDISYDAYINTMYKDLEKKNYKEIDNWFSQIVTEVFKQFAPDFGIVEI